jgi:hypothetical protein
MSYLRDIFNSVVGVLLFLVWTFGFVLAKGFWSTLCCFFPPWAFYLVIEHIALKLGWL